MPKKRIRVKVALVLVVLSLLVTAVVLFLPMLAPSLNRKNSNESAHKDLSQQVSYSKEELCGPLSLHTAVSMLGLQQDFPVLARACDPSPEGVSMATLKKVAGTLGLDAKGYKMSWDQLLEVQSPAILYVKPKHFVTVNPSEYMPDESTDRIRVFDSDKSPEWWSREELEKKWSGETLVLSEAPGHKTLKGPRVKFYCLIHDLGDVRVPINKKFDLSLDFENIGDEAVEIGRIKTTCGCTETAITGKVIAPGQRGKIDVEVNLDKVRGPFNHLVIVETNDKTTPIVKTRITGRTFNTQLTFRSQLVLNTIPRLGSTSQSFVLKDPGDESLKAENIKFRISPASFTDHNGPLNVQARATPYDSKEHSLLTADGNDVVVEVDVAAGESAPIGEFEALLEIMTQIPGNEQIKIPIRGTVISNIMAKPAALFFSSVNGEPISKSITIASRIAHRIDLCTISVPANLPLKVEKVSEEKVIVLTAKYSPSGGQASIITGDIVCGFADETVLKIPVVIHSQSRQ
jgi:hypothetical protein